MAQVDIIIRIELRGSPGSEVYEKLHTYMTTTNGWATTLKADSGVLADLPHAMYAGTFDEAKLANLSSGLKNHIANNIWTKCIVLVMKVPAWSRAES